MNKVKSSKNKAAQVETLPQINIENMSSEELAELQAEQYERIISAQNNVAQAQNNIRIIKTVLEKRKSEQEKSCQKETIKELGKS